MCKTVAIFQQTFVQDTASSSSATFNFTRVMKTKHDQHFVVKSLGITRLAGSNPGEIYLKGFAAMSGRCNTHFSNQGDTNDLFLGTLGDSTSIEPSFMVDELPLGKFHLVCERDGGAVVSKFAVSFQISLMEAD
jgi:hypothetical protein